MSGRVAHLSIHDVAPDTMGVVGGMLRVLREEAGVERAMLLVIPGLEWGKANLERLRAWTEEGHVLAGHGWAHHVERRRTLWHKLHGWTISRFVAEHLSLDAEEISELIRRNHAWFGEHGFDPPTHYVPPAWAMGSISRGRLRELPFRTYETLGGVYDAERDRFTRMPLAGFEADTALRAAVLRGFNRWNARRARSGGRLRIALHPHDLDLRLAREAVVMCKAHSTRPELPTGEGNA